MDKGKTMMEAQTEAKRERERAKTGIVGRAAAAIYDKQGIEIRFANSQSLASNSGWVAGSA